jgi:GNAT superfamily N-acetyltransferase
VADISIDRVTVPSSIDDADAADFVAMIELGSRNEADVIGPFHVYPPREQLPWWHSPERPKHAVVARLGGRVVGSGTAELTDDPESTAVWITVDVEMEFRRQGIGSALFDAAAALMPEKTTQQVYVLYRPAIDGDRIPSPTGSGSVPLDDPGTRFLLARGFALEQVERVSSLRLPVDVAAALEEASAAAGDDYSVHLWSGATPERWLEDLAAARSRMASDAPWAGVEPDSGNWTPERVREADAREAAGGRVKLTAIAEHLPSGRLVAYNELSVPPERERAVSQYDTLVLGDHRGHRLGMLVKAANLLELQRTHPGHPEVGTYNAEENRHMLSVNEALGFVPVGYEGAWRRDL